MSRDKDEERRQHEALMKRMDRLAGNADKAEDTAEAARAESGLRTTLKAAGALGRFLQGAGGILGRIYSWGIKPVWDIVKPTVNWLTDFYKNRIWTPLAYNKDENGDRTIFSKKGASAAVALTVAFAVAAGPILGAAAEGVVMATTARTKTVSLYFPNSHNDGTYSVRGCEKVGVEKDACNVEDSVYYNVESSIARHVWSYAAKKSRFLPKKVVGPINFNSENTCEVLIYDAPIEWLWEQFDSYPELLDVSCSAKAGQIDGSIQQDFSDAGQHQDGTAAPTVQQQRQVAAKAVVPAPG